jgi:predicted amidophosphoribosyltransferase
MREHAVMLDAVRHALADALTFVLPIDCAGCGAADVALCASCRNALRAAPRERSVAGVRVASALDFDGVAARVLRAVKEEGRTSLLRVLGPAVREAAAGLASGAEVVVVPVPTSRAAMRRRGYRVAELLARRAGWHPIRGLRVVRRTADQRRLGRDERRRNVEGSMAARGLDGCRVLIVDDVVTTGATLAEAARAVAVGGGEVIGAVTAAATARRSGGASSHT